MSLVAPAGRGPESVQVKRGAGTGIRTRNLPITSTLSAVGIRLQPAVVVASLQGTPMLTSVVVRAMVPSSDASSDIDVTLGVIFPAPSGDQILDVVIMSLRADRARCRTMSPGRAGSSRLTRCRRRTSLPGAIRARETAPADKRAAREAARPAPIRELPTCG
jgi:hypothetical protein